jgi:hypothetical protein
VAADGAAAAPRLAARLAAVVPAAAEPERPVVRAGRPRGPRARAAERRPRASTD